VTAAAFLLCMLYPLYLGVATQWKNYTYAATIDKLQISQGEFLEIKAQEDALKTERDRYLAMLQNEKSLLSGKMELLNAIKEKRAARTSKNRILSLLFTYVNRHGILIDKLRVEGNRYLLDLQAAKDDDFTAFLKSVTPHKEFLVEMQGFAYSTDQKAYQTQITIEVLQ
jgi:hypothetical protein